MNSKLRIPLCWKGIGAVPVALSAWCVWKLFATERTIVNRVARDVPPEPPGSELSWFREAGRWLALGAIFGVWALGPWLTIAGRNAGLPLPAILFPYVPILSNARMPGRAVVVLMLAVALMSALAIRTIRRRWIVALLMAVVVLDFVPAPFPTVAIAREATINVHLAAHPGGPDPANRANIVCPLPLGLRDGYGDTGHFDSGVLLDQMAHGHPIAGGFIGRLPPRLRASYRSAPILRSLLALSAGEPASEADLALTPFMGSQSLLSQNIGFIVVDRAAASDALVSFLSSRLVTRKIYAEPSGRELYQILATPGP